MTHQFVEDPFGLRMMGIDAQAALAVVVLEIVGAGTAPPQSKAARAVALRRRFHFDHVSAHFRQDSGASRTGDKLGEIEDSVALQHSWFFNHRLAPPGLFLLS